WGAYPPLVGFLAVVFRAHPDWIGRLVPADCDPKVADGVAAALWLAGRETESLQSCLRARGSDPRLAAELTGLPPRLEDLQIATPT
ncbi:hypothetical protein RSW15_24590, partial [Escherichia coli]|uniref:hypothetical protein n=1 Tax=Escherichia coli TaxID=562 RepID=UPI0028DE9E9F